MIIDQGLPEDRDAWPQGVLEALRVWRQGDVVQAPPFFHWTRPDHAVWVPGHQPDNPGVLAWPEIITPRFAIVTTQTCDIGEEDCSRPSRPFIQLAPVYDVAETLDGGLRKLLERGAGSQYLVHVPDLVDADVGEFWVADLRVEVPIDKGWLATKTRIEGFIQEDARQRFGERTAMLRSRPAFSDRFVSLIQRPFVDALKELRASDRDLFEKLDAQVVEFGAELDSRLAPTLLVPWFLCDEEPDADVVSWLEAWVGETQDRVAHTELTVMPSRIVSFDDISGRKLRSLTTVPLVRFSRG